MQQLAINKTLQQNPIQSGPSYPGGPQ
jgi:hypothetical protein